VISRQPIQIPVPSMPQHRMDFNHRLPGDLGL
jgi:hypothetical protein